MKPGGLRFSCRKLMSVLGVISLLVLEACSNLPPAQSDSDTLTTSESKKWIAVMPFSVKAPDTYGYQKIDLTAAEMLTTALLKTGKFIVVERSTLDKVLKEQGLGLAGFIDTSTAAEVGKILGVQALVTGAVSQIGIAVKEIGIGGYGGQLATMNVSLDVRLIDTTTGAILMADVGRGSHSAPSVPMSGTGSSQAKTDRSESVGKALREATDDVARRIIAQMQKQEPPEPDPPQTSNPSKKSAKAGAYWNSWLQNQKSRPELLESLEADKTKTYTFVLDLSPLNYRALDIYTTGSVPVDPILEREIQRLVHDENTKISLRIRPILIGTGLTLSSTENQVNEPHNFDLERLKNPTLHGDDRAALRSGKLSLEAFSHKIRAGLIRLDLQATEPGCKAIALSVWNASGTLPLDHLVHEFSVHGPGEKPHNCYIGGNPLRGGLKTLLQSMISGDANRRIEADAGLHIFELEHYGGHLVSHAVYMQREKPPAEKQLSDDGTSTPPHREKEPLFVKHWALPEPLSHFVVNPEKLEQHVMAARKKAELSRGKDKPIWAYDGVAKALADIIFTSSKPGTEAREKLDELTRSSDRRILLMTRLVSAKNTSLFLPLGLLSARGHNQVLSRPVTVVQQMANQRVSRGEPCIGSWAFAIPSRLGGLPDKPALPQITPGAPWFIGWLSDRAALESYMNGTLSGQSQPSGEGLILLAHHSEGDIWYEESDKLGLGKITRAFPAGSVAILSACRMGNFRGQNTAIIEMLNRGGIEAAIFSPFKIDAFYGAALATQFATIVHQRMSAGQSGTVSAGARNTLVDLFHMAVEEAGKNMAQPVSEMGLEYIIIGNHALKLCEG